MHEIKSAITGAVQATAENHNNNSPEWLRIPAACQRFGVGRSWLYLRITNGEIKSASIRQRGAIRGIRLVSRDSLAAFIERQAAGEEVR
jgi:hypothetical protein